VVPRRRRRARQRWLPPTDLSDFGNYVYAVVSRYRGHIRYYQIWNEPNIYPEWGEQAVDPEGYTRLLCEAYRRAKEADPDAVIISGALAQTIAAGGAGPE
jgi:GH35 family endo-1,4-beta-xylanase